MATLYFNGIVDGNLATEGNWWTDAEFTVPGTVPTTTDTAIITTGSPDSNSGSPQCEPGDLQIGGTITVLFGIAVVNSVTFSDTASFSTGAQITAATISFASGTGMTGGQVIVTTATFTNANCTDGTIQATTVSFIGTASATTPAQITANVSFTGTGSNTATIIGTATFNDGTFNNGANIVGSAVFNGSAYNTGLIDVNARFNGTGTNTGGTVTGQLTVPGTVDGDKLTVALTATDLGTYGSLAVSGIPTGGAGGGPLGGPGISL